MLLYFFQGGIKRCIGRAVTLGLERDIKTDGPYATALKVFNNVSVVGAWKREGFRQGLHIVLADTDNNNIGEFLASHSSPLAFNRSYRC